MRAGRSFLLVVALVAAGLAGPTPGVGARPAAAAAFIDIGGDDTLVWLTPWETAWLASALENNSQWNCAPPGIRIPRVARFFNKFCAGYNAYTRIAYWRVKVFLKYAVQRGGCGAFVIDGASWRPPRVRPAEAWSSASNSNMAHVSSGIGTTEQFKTKTGYTAARCSEYRWPQRESNIVPRSNGLDWGS